MGQKSSLPKSTLPTIMPDGNSVNPGLSNGQHKLPRPSNGLGNGITRTKILLLGLRRWVPFPRPFEGLGSLCFNKLHPKQTFYLETTIRITKHTFECVRCHIYSYVDMNATHQHSDPYWNMGLSRKHHSRGHRYSFVGVLVNSIRHWHSGEFRL